MSSLANDVLVFQQTKNLTKNDFSIMDEHGDQLARVETGGSALGRIFMGARDLTVLEGADRPVLRVKDTVTFGRDRMEILDAGGDRIATLVKRISLLKTRITLEMHGEEVDLEGDILGFEFQVNGSSGVMGTVSREWSGLGNAFMGMSTYSLQLAEHLTTPQRHALLGSVIALDLIREKQSKN